MKRSASEKIRNLELRIQHLEKSAGTKDFFKSYKSRAVDIVDTLNSSKIFPHRIYATRPEKTRIRTKQAKAVFKGYIAPRGPMWGYDVERTYQIVFLSDDKYRSPFEYPMDDLYTQGSFTIFIDRKAVATAKNGVIDRTFLSKVKRALHSKR